MDVGIVPQETWVFLLAHVYNGCNRIHWFGPVDLQDVSVENVYNRVDISR